MNKLAKFAILSSTLLTSHTLNATPPSGKLTGYIELSKSLNYSCEIEININENSADIATKPDGYMCAILSYSNNTYNITRNNNIITFHDVEFITLETGDCYGDLIAEWNGTYLFFDTVLPAKTVGAPCYFAGLVY